jgi:hypothetical protein
VEKLIENDFDYFGEPVVSVIEDWSGEGLTKSASDSQISDFVKSIVPDPTKIYLHILAMGAGETYGANRNGDWFPDDNLKKCYKTFEETGYIYRHHKNKDPATSMGKVIFAIYNERMHRVELIAWVDKAKGADIVGRIESGDYPATSMACRTAFDECSICGNKARTKQEYCEHIQTNLGRMYPDGRKVMCLNVAPLKFIDQSIVIRPADPTSSVLQKVAHVGGPAVSSAELAELAGLTEKQAAHRKLSELIKEIDGGQVVNASPSINALLSKVGDPELGSVPNLARHDMGQVLHAMADLGISPSIKYLAELIGHKISGESVQGIGDLVEGYLQGEGLGNLVSTDKDFSAPNAIHPEIIDILAPSLKQASLLPEYVTQRALVTNYGTFVPNVEGTGYMNTGVSYAESPMEQYKRILAHPDAKKPGGILEMLKTLAVIGGAALAAKWYITKTIDEKTREAAKQNTSVKILLVKSASDYKSTYHLAEQDMINSLKKLVS